MAAATLNSGNGGFEEGSFTGWNSDREGTGGTYSKSIGDAPVLGGSHAAEFKLKVTNSKFDILRNEIAKKDVATMGGSYVYEFGQYVPTDFATSPLFIETAQFLPDKQWNGAYKGWGPPLLVGIKDGRWKLHFARNVNGKKVVEKLDLGLVTRNKWTRFKVDVKWSATSTGYVRVYKDEKKVLDRIGSTTYSSTEVPYFKCGMYTRREWTLSGSAPLHSFRIVHDSFSVKKVG
jgi:hypothetical protein